MANTNFLTRRSFVKFAASAVPAYKLGSLSSIALTRSRLAITYICPPCGLNCDTREFDKPGTCPVCGMTLINKQEIKPGEQVSIEKFMEFYKIPGLSLAIIDNFKIAATKTYGVTEAGGSTPVTTRTLFQAGSVSKPVATLAALHLVEQGKLSLDEDVNRKLKSWKLPENEFTKDQKVTLRRIMSHSAGTTLHGFPGYAVGDQMPTLVQVLNGEKPANNPPVFVDIIPGTKWRYSGGGVLIEQQLMIDVTSKAFPELMHKIVFEKLGINDITFEPPEYTLFGIVVPTDIL